MRVHIIANRTLFAKTRKHSDALVAVQFWFDAARRAQWQSLEDVRRTFPATDMVGALAIFNIKGNHYRLIVRVNFLRQRIFIKKFLKHAEYDKGAWKKWLP